MQSIYNEEKVHIDVRSDTRQPVSEGIKNMFFQSKTYSDDSMNLCDLKLKIVCQDILSIFSSGDLGVYALLAKDYLADWSPSLITSSSGRSVSEAFSLYMGETSTSSSNTGEEQDRTRADLLMPASPVDFSSVIFSSIRALWVFFPAMQLAELKSSKTQGQSCPSLTTALGFFSDPVSRRKPKAMHKEVFLNSGSYFFDNFAQNCKLYYEWLGSCAPSEVSVNIPNSSCDELGHIQKSEFNSNVKNNLPENKLTNISATCKQYASFPTSVMHDACNKYGFASVSKNMLKFNRWGIPCGMKLAGGGESAANGWGGAAAQSQNWGPNGNQANPQGQWGNSGPNRNNGPQNPDMSSSNNLKSTPSAANNTQQNAIGNQATNGQSKNTISGAATGQQTPQPSQQGLQPAQTSPPNPVTSSASNIVPNSWAQAAGKGLTTSSNSSEVQKLQSIKEALLSCEGWGGENVNQESSWDLPPSPEPTKGATPPHWKIVANNGCDLWENNLRNGGVAPPKVQQAPWGKDPTCHFGGTWGDEDDSVDTSNDWMNTSSNPSTPGGGSGAGVGGGGGTFPPTAQGNIWLAHQKKAPEWGPNTNWGEHGPPSRPTAEGVGGDWASHKPGPHVGPLIGSHQSSNPSQQPSGHPGPLPGPHSSHPPPHPSQHPGQHAGLHPPHPSLHPGSHNAPHNVSLPPNHSATHPGNHPAPPQHQMPQHNQHSVPHQPTHGSVVAPGNMGINRFNSGHGGKDSKNSGWEEPSPPPIRRDDGTAIWGKPNQQSVGVSHWKEGGPGQHMMSHLGSAPMQANRLPGPAMPVGQIKSDQRMWGQHGRNGNWPEGSHEMPSQVWGDEAKAGWSEPQITSPSWIKPKMPGGGMHGSNWHEQEIEAGPWGGSQNKQVPKGMTTNTRHLRNLIDKGLIKREDIEAALRNNNLNLDDSLLDLGHRTGSDAWPSASIEEHSSVPFEMSNQNYPQRFPQSHQPLPFNSQPSGGGNAQVSQQARALMNHIQVAVRAGYLNPQILNQPLAPSTLLLLNQMLSSINFLHKLLQQQTILQSQAHVNKNAHQQILSYNVHITKTRQTIQNTQNQIAAQQAIYVKQQPHQHQGQPPIQSHSHLPPNLSVSGHMNPQNDFKSGLTDQFYNNFSDMNVADSHGVNQMEHHGSRLNQWKQPLVNDVSLVLSNDFSRTPGKPSLPQSQSSPNMPPIMSASASAWPSSSRPNESGWLDSATTVPDGPTSATVGVDKSIDGLESTWPSQTGAGSYGLDIKPFEPGKPWMMKNIEDDPTVTPGSVTRSPLSLGIQDSELLTSITKTTASSASSDLSANAPLSSLPLSSNTWTFNPSTGPHGANSPLSSDSKLVGNNGRSKGTAWSEGPQNSELWGASGINKSRGPPPGISANAASKGGGCAPVSSAGGGGSWGAIGRSTSWSGEQQRNSSNSALHSVSNPWPTSQLVSTWLILKNLTPQIDGSTLKTLCLQHGPLVNFHLSLNHGFALVSYGTREEAAKAQGNLNNCLLSNTTILAEFASETEINQVLAGQASTWAASGRGPTPTSQPQNSKVDSWASGGDSVASSSLWGNGPTSAASLWSGSSFAEGGGDQHRATPSSMKSYLPDGLLNSESM